MQDFYKINKIFEPNFQFQHPSTNELILSTSQCSVTCFNNEISACWLLMFARSRRCDKSMNEYTYHINRQHIVHIFQKLKGSHIHKIYQHENESFLQRIFQFKFTLQQQSVQKDAKWTYFHPFFKEGRRRYHNQPIWHNICLTVCLYTIFFRNKRGLLETHSVLKS